MKKVGLVFFALVLGCTSDLPSDEELFGSCIKWDQHPPVYVKIGETLIPVEQDSTCSQRERS